MAYSDESDLGLHKVKEYCFENGKQEPISFAVLPLYLEEEQEEETTTRMQQQIKKVFLNAHTVPVNTRIYKQVIGWKLEVSTEKAIIWVLRKDKTWVQLTKPRRAYFEKFPSIFVTIECFQHVYLNPNIHVKQIWSHLVEFFAHYDIRPLKRHLRKHHQHIQHFCYKNDVLKEAKVMVALARDYGEDLMLDETSENQINAENFDEEEIDPVCSFCDNGGAVLCCEGRCLRSFHATKADGDHSYCQSLGFSAADVEAIPNFYCSNCKEKRHQCYACGELGCSDNFSGPEVFRCSSCGYFYHPKCVAKFLHPINEADAAAKELSIGTGEDFACPLHQCLICRRVEEKKIKDLQLAVCRRCPKAYHRKCLPKEIFFENSGKPGIARAWDGLLPNKVLIYCLDHEIVRKLKTPLRNHIILSKQNDLEASSKHEDENILEEGNFSKNCTTEETSITKHAEFFSAKGNIDNNKGKILSTSRELVKEVTALLDTSKMDSKLAITKSNNPCVKSEVKADEGKQRYVDEHSEEPQVRDADQGKSFPNTRGISAPDDVKQERKHLLHSEVKGPVSQKNLLRQTSIGSAENLIKRNVKEVDAGLRHQDHKKCKVAARDHKTNVKGTSLAPFEKQTRDPSREPVKSSPWVRSASFNLLEEQPSSNLNSRIHAGKEHGKKFSQNVTPADTRNSLEEQHNSVSGLDVSSTKNRSAVNVDRRGEVSNISSRREERDAGLYHTPASRHQVGTSKVPGVVGRSDTGIKPNVSNFRTSSTSNYVNRNLHTGYGDGHYRRSSSSMNQDRQWIGSSSVYPSPVPSAEGLSGNRSTSATYAPRLDESNASSQSRSRPQYDGPKFRVGMGASSMDASQRHLCYLHHGFAGVTGSGGWIVE